MRDGDVVRIESGLTHEDEVREAEQEVQRLEGELAAARRALNLRRHEADTCGECGSNTRRYAHKMSCSEGSK
jgi:hypothetical protein